MDEDGRNRNRSSVVDWISNLPDSLLCQILLNLPTKDAVKTNVLSSRWRNLWRYVPGLDLEIGNFPEHDSFVSFIDSFLGVNSESRLHSFKIKYDSCGADHEPETGLIRRWINTVVNRKVEHIDVLDDSYESWDIPMPLTIYTCESLVSIMLCGLTLPSPNLVSLPSLRVIILTIPKFGHDLALETLISRCPVLECLSIDRSLCDDVEVLRVRSQSLLRFTHVADGVEDLVEDLVVEIDAPKLEYLSLGDYRVATFILNNSDSLVKADIDIVFNLISKRKFSNDLPKRNMIRNFLLGISGVKDMIIASCTLEVLYDYSRCEPLPLFPNLSSLRVELYGYRWEMLPVFLEICPNLKSLVVGSNKYQEKDKTIVFSGPRRFLSSLEYVKIERPLKGKSMEMKLVDYLLKNSTILKKLTLCFDNSTKKKESDIFKELLTIPRLSASCQVVVL